MTATLRSELRKVLGTRMGVGLVLGALAFIVVALSFSLWGSETANLTVEGAPERLATVDDVVAMLGIANAVGIFALLFGVTFATAEYRHSTIAATFILEPRRWRVVTAKGIVAVATGVVYAAVTLAATFGIVWLYTAQQGIDLPLGAPVTQFAGALVVSVGLSAALGVGIGTLIRSQMAAIVVTLLWLLVGESLLASFLPKVARWTPFAAGNAMTAPDGELSHAVAAVVVVGYVVVAMAAGAWLTERRDAA